MRIRYILRYAGIAYLGTVFLFSGVSFVGLAIGKGGGEYVPYLHWPIKLLSLLR